MLRREYRQGGLIKADVSWEAMMQPPQWMRLARKLSWRRRMSGLTGDWWSTDDGIEWILYYRSRLGRHAEWTAEGEAG
jgi:hypothetical protein